VTLYLLADLNVKLIPQLKKMKPGSRSCRIAFDMKCVTPDRASPSSSRRTARAQTSSCGRTPLKVEEKKDKDKK